MLKLTLITIRRFAMPILPKEVLARLKVDKPDSIFLTQEEGDLRFGRFDPDFGEIMPSAREAMNRRRNALRDLAG